MLALAAARRPTRRFGVARSFSGRRWVLANERRRGRAGIDARARSAAGAGAIARVARRRRGRGAGFPQPDLETAAAGAFGVQGHGQGGGARASARSSRASASRSSATTMSTARARRRCCTISSARSASRPRIYIPDRMTEGYGPSARGDAHAEGRGRALVITVDCGATATEALTAARDAGLDVIVLDHHAVEAPPPAFAQVNPNQHGDTSGRGICAPPA